MNVLYEKPTSPSSGNIPIKPKKVLQELVVQGTVAVPGGRQNGPKNSR